MKKNTLLWRARARLLFRVLLAVGFILQSYTFLKMYLLYPSMLQLDVDQPNEVDIPAFTVCNLNEIRASRFCEKYPHKCGNPETVPDFCDNFPEFCKLINDSSKQLPAVPIDVFTNLSRYEQQLFGHQWENLVVNCTVHIDDDVKLCSGSPILVPALSHSNRVPYNCFMMNSLYEKPDAKPEQVPLSAAIHIHLNVEVPEYHPYHLSRGAQIAIHSPYVMPSPTREGQLLNLGKIYRIYLQVAEQNLLPAPYHSNCTDYMKQWRENGGKGPVNFNMCLEKCKLDRSLELYGCVNPQIDYPNNETICSIEMHNFQSKARSACYGRCAMPCDLRKYVFQVQEANSEGDRKSCYNDSSDLSCAILVQIFLENMEITTFTYRPTFEAVGILSWIGGYVGLWLGISLMHVYDFLERGCFRLAAMLRKKYCRKKVVSRKKLYPDNHATTYHYHRRW